MRADSTSSILGFHALPVDHTFATLETSVFSLLLGDALDAAAIATVLVINTALGFTTEYRARQAMHALLALEAPRAIVLRDDVLLEVAARELVPGDVIEIEAGHAVPADARVFSAEDCRVNEAALTGESAPAVKVAEPVSAEATLTDRRSMVYAGTLVVAGGGRAVVTATGPRTELGRIGELVSGIEQEPTPLEHRLDALGKKRSPETKTGTTAPVPSPKER